MSIGSPRNSGPPVSRRSCDARNRFARRTGSEHHCRHRGRETGDIGLVGSSVFAVFVKYNALMALSAASLPFALPANLALGLIMIAGQACSRALVVSAKPASHTDLGIALAIGFAPAALIGTPGLIGLAGAIVARIAFLAFIRRRRSVTAADVEGTQQLTEVCFYLSTLAAGHLLKDKAAGPPFGEPLPTTASRTASIMARSGKNQIVWRKSASVWKH